MEKTTLYQDPLFRRIASGSTGLGFASMVGWLASLNLNHGGRLEFTWRWTIPLWMGAAVLFNWRLWNALWSFQSSPSPSSKRRLVLFSVATAALGLGSFLYPIRFIASSNYGPILRGLLTGVFFLGVLGAIMISLFRGMNEEPKGGPSPRD